MPKPPKRDWRKPIRKPTKSNMAIIGNHGISTLPQSQYEPGSDLPENVNSHLNNTATSEISAGSENPTTPTSLVEEYEPISVLSENGNSHLKSAGTSEISATSENTSTPMSECDDMSSIPNREVATYQNVIAESPQFAEISQATAIHEIYTYEPPQPPPQVVNGDSEPDESVVGPTGEMAWQMQTMTTEEIVTTGNETTTDTDTMQSAQTEEDNSSLQPEPRIVASLCLMSNLHDVPVVSEELLEVPQSADQPDTDIVPMDVEDVQYKSLDSYDMLVSPLSPTASTVSSEGRLTVEVFCGFDENDGGKIKLEDSFEDPLQRLIDEQPRLKKQRMNSDLEDQSASEKAYTQESDGAEDEEESLLKPMETIASAAAVNAKKVQHPAAKGGPGRPRLHGYPSKRSPKDEFYKKPYEYGWRRELVWRAHPETSKDKADVYFISPSGKKLRKRTEIAPLLEGDLTIDHFCFTREATGAGPEFETIRSAKPSSRNMLAPFGLASSAANQALPVKRVVKPKVPKGASPPLEGWTPTKALKDNNALLSSGNGLPKYSGPGPSVSPSLGRHGGSQQHHNAIGGGSGGHSSVSSTGNHRSSGRNKRISTVSRDVPAARSLPGTVSTSSSSPSTERASRRADKKREPCSVQCPKAVGKVPQLQCAKCLSLFHHECVGLNRATCGYRVVAGDGRVPLSLAGREYTCEPCLIKASLPPHHKNLEIRLCRYDNHKLLQNLAVVKGKKYVTVSKALPTPTSNTVNDFESDIKKINENILKRLQKNFPVSSSATASTPMAKKSNALPLTVNERFDLPSTSREAMERLNARNSQGSPAKSDVSTISGNGDPATFATHFFGHTSIAYDVLLCILQFLNINQRAVFAEVCRLWNLAAKDGSLWRSLILKNSYVHDWSGFAAAMRRGETRRLNLHKMLLPSERIEEWWDDFSEYIGTVYSIESIELCRCPVRVVESLFASNKRLQKLNATSIDDGIINIQNVNQLTRLEELRLRTVETGCILDGDLGPLAYLTRLQHLSMANMRSLGTKSIEVLSHLTELRSLELGECGQFDSTFATIVLPRLEKLQRLRLENAQETSCNTNEILDSVSKLPLLTQLEMINFDVKEDFDRHLRDCVNIRRLLIIPTYQRQSAHTNQIMLRAAHKVMHTLEVFTWGITVELLCVTAMYIDSASGMGATPNFQESVPVLKPVPGDNTVDYDDGNHNVSRQPEIKIMPLQDVEAILDRNLTHTKCTIVRVPYHATYKQQLIK